MGFDEKLGDDHLTKKLSRVDVSFWFLAER